MLWLIGLTAACEDTSYRKIGAEITVLAKRSQDPRVDGARQRLVAFGAAAIPQIETALHTAQERGRLHLVAALQDIGDAEAIPILRHFAVYDSSAEVRASCETILKGWSAATATAPPPPPAPNAPAWRWRGWRSCGPRARRPRRRDVRRLGRFGWLGRLRRPSQRVIWGGAGRLPAPAQVLWLCREARLGSVRRPFNSQRRWAGARLRFTASGKMATRSNRRPAGLPARREPPYFQTMPLVPDGHHCASAAHRLATTGRRQGSRVPIHSAKGRFAACGKTSRPAR